MITGHGGNITALAHRLGCSTDEITDMSSNLNPLGPPEGLEDFIGKNLARIRSLPQADAADMVEAFSRYHDVDPSRVLAGNGTTWFIYTLPAALPSGHTLILGPTYSDYRDGCLMNEGKVSYILARPERDFQPDLDTIDQVLVSGQQGVDTVVICNPNNPTGSLVRKEAILELVRRHPSIFFIVDESYLPFVPEAESITLVGENRYPNLVVLSSMSKIYTMPGLRTGFVCAHAEVIARLKDRYQPWSVNSLAQASVVYLFDHARAIRPFIRKTRDFVLQERDWFVSSLSGLSGLKLYPTCTSFVLAEILNGMSSADLCTAVGDQRILIRNCDNFEGLSDRFVRFSLKTREINTKLSETLKLILG